MVQYVASPLPPHSPGWACELTLTPCCIRRIVTLIFCPAFLAAGNYLVLGLLIAKHGYVVFSSIHLTEA